MLVRNTFFLLQTNPGLPAHALFKAYVHPATRYQELSSSFKTVSDA